MHDITAIAAAKPGSTRSPNFVKNQRWFPTIYDLRRGAKRRLPHFAYEYGDGGARRDTRIKDDRWRHGGIEVNRRCGDLGGRRLISSKLCGRKYSARLGSLR